MTAHQSITLPAPLPYQLPALHAVHGPKEAGGRLRNALRWAVENFAEWRGAVANRSFDLVLPAFDAPRLENNLPHGGVALVRIDANVLRFLLIEPGRKTVLDQPLPEYLRR